MKELLEVIAKRLVEIILRTGVAAVKQITNVL